MTVIDEPKKEDNRGRKAAIKTSVAKPSGKWLDHHLWHQQDLSNYVLTMPFPDYGKATPLGCVSHTKRVQLGLETIAL